MSDPSSAARPSARRRPPRSLTALTALAALSRPVAGTTPAPITPYPTEPLPAGPPPSTPAPTALVVGASAWPTDSPAAAPVPLPCALGPAAADPGDDSQCPPDHYCALPPGTCVPAGFGSGSDVWDGTCAPLPPADNCVGSLAVCGCDGAGYANECLAAAAGTSVRNAGPCADVATPAPSAGSTARPTPLPTPFPTPLSTRRPTRQPTTSPTADPSSSPTVPPSRSATPRPTGEPTEMPTDPPSRSPTPWPTGEPTEISTEVPQAAPSATPTRKPTPEPTAAPTDNPTASPLGSPTLRPSRNPVVGTARPTRSLTLKPSASPITDLPTELPTPRPSRGPAAQPPPLQGPAQTPGLSITLRGITGIESVRRWEKTTADFYARVYDESPAVAVDEVTVAITSVTDAGTRRTRRGLQADAAVEVTYTQTTSYRSDLTIEEIARLPLETPLRRDEYVAELKDLEGYEQLTAVSAIAVASDGDDNIDGDKVIDGDEDAGGGLPLPLGAIIGIAAGGLALIILVAGFVYARRRGGKDEDDSDPPLSPSASSVPDARASASGGTGMTNASLPTYGDGSVATVDYDYSKAYGGAGDHSLSEAGGTLGSRTRLTAAEDVGAGGNAAAGARPNSGGTIFSDDATFDRAYEDVREELLDVYAPAGKLGVVIDTPDDGAPVVHAVKDASPVADRIRVGDKLVAVDDEDVRAMTAIKVSKLISRKSSNASRKLTLIRHVPIRG